MTVECQRVWRGPEITFIAGVTGPSDAGLRRWGWKKRMDELVIMTKVGPVLGSWSGGGLGPCAGARPVGTYVRGGYRCTVANGSEGSEKVVSGTMVDDVVVGARILRG
jgi:hypothetical protein